MNISARWHRYTPVFILAAGFVVALGLRAVSTRAAPESSSRILEPVKVILAQSRPIPDRVLATGVVSPAREVTVSAEVGGSIVWRSEALIPGGRFEAGQPMARVDPRDYEVAIQQEQSRVQAAKLALQQEQGRQKVAAREWKRLGGNAPKSSLALRKPHLRAAQSSLQSAEGGLVRAQLNLERTTLRAPFRSVVIKEEIEIGQHVMPGAGLIHLVGTESLWVNVSLPVENLDRVRLPAGLKDTSAGSEVLIRQRLGNGQSIEKKGRVIKLAGQLDPQTRRAQVLVEIDDPFGLKKAQDGSRPEGLASRPPMLPGAYVEVEIQGSDLENAFQLPAEAVWGGGSIWVVDSESALSRRQIRVHWTDGKTAVVTGELQDGDRVVTSPMSTPVAGTEVRIVTESKSVEPEGL